MECASWGLFVQYSIIYLNVLYYLFACQHTLLNHQYLCPLQIRSGMTTHILWQHFDVRFVLPDLLLANCSKHTVLEGKTEKDGCGSQVHAGYWIPEWPTSLGIVALGFYPPSNMQTDLGKTSHPDHGQCMASPLNPQMAMAQTHWPAKLGRHQFLV